MAVAIAPLMLAIQAFLCVLCIRQHRNLQYKGGSDVSRVTNKVTGRLHQDGDNSGNSTSPTKRPSNRSLSHHHFDHWGNPAKGDNTNIPPGILSNKQSHKKLPHHHFDIWGSSSEDIQLSREKLYHDTSPYHEKTRNLPYKLHIPLRTNSRKLPRQNLDHWRGSFENIDPFNDFRNVRSERVGQLWSDHWTDV